MTGWLIVNAGEVGSAARAIHDSLKPLEGEAVIQKGAADAFHGTQLEERLRQKGVKHVVLGGLRTPICVFATTMGAAYRGFNCRGGNRRAWHRSHEGTQC